MDNEEVLSIQVPGSGFQVIPIEPSEKLTLIENFH